MDIFFWANKHFIKVYVCCVCYLNLPPPKLHLLGRGSRHCRRGGGDAHEGRRGRIVVALGLTVVVLVVAEVGEERLEGVLLFLLLLQLFLHQKYNKRAMAL